MTRQEAIEMIISTWLQRDGEFVCSDTEADESKRELRDALLALGVTDDEMGLR